MIFKLPKIIGHRGVKDIAPENTILGISKAIEHNLEWVEIDVKVSKDNIPFLLHDDLLDRTTSGKGYPYNYSLEDINSASNSYESFISPSSFEGNITLHYFGHQN